MTIASLIASTSVDAAPRKRKRANDNAVGTAVRTNAGMTSGYVNKFFKNTLVTFMEEREIAVDSVLNAGTSTGMALLKSDALGNAPKYKLCIPCVSIAMKGNVSLVENDNPPGESCYIFGASADASSFVVTPGAIQTCGDLTGKRLSIRSNDTYNTIADSANLAIVKNDFAVDYNNIAQEKDTESQELGQVYLDAKANAISQCVNDDFKKAYDTVKGLFIGSAAASGVATGTGVAGTIVSATNIAKKDSGIDYKKLKELVKIEEADKTYWTCYAKDKELFGEQTCGTQPATSGIQGSFAKALAYNELYNEVFTDRFVDMLDKYNKATNEDVKTEYLNTLDSMKANGMTKLTKDNISNLTSFKSSLEAKMNTIETVLNGDIEADDKLKAKYNLSKNGGNIASAALSGVTALGGVGSSIMGFTAAGEIDKLINNVKDCKKAAEKMYNAGIDLENQLKELTGKGE